MEVDFITYSALLELTKEQPDSGNTVFVKGFASVAIVDREGEIASPEEFDVKTFMNAPTLLENHKFLKDEFGNDRAAGKVVFAEPSYIAGTLSSDELSWEIRSLADGSYVNSLLKEKVPNLSEGAKGLFVVAEVHHPDSVERVKRGELGAFSWAGLSYRRKRQDGVYELREIDLMEVSLVNIPANNQATFMVGKSMQTHTEYSKQDLQNTGVVRMRFNKLRYDSQSVEKFMASKGVKNPSIFENEDSFFADFDDRSKYEVSKSIAIGMGDLAAIVAPRLKKDDDFPVAEFVGNIELKEVKKMSETKVQRLYLIDESALGSRVKFKTELQKSATLEDGSALEIHTLEFEAVEVETPSEVSAESVVESAVETPVEDAVETVVTNTEVPAEPEVPSYIKDLFGAIESLKNELAEVKATAKQVKDLEAKQAGESTRIDEIVKAFNSFIPDQPARPEHTQKNMKTEKESPSEILSRFIPKFSH